MIRLLLVAAASAAMIVPAAPAQGQELAAAGFTSGSAFRGALVGRPPPRTDGVRIHRGLPNFGCDGRRGRDRHDGRRDGRFDCAVVGGAFAYDYSSDINRSWDSDSFNDWWHDRPDRAYPRWMQKNQNCDRMWYSADTLRC
jgi:hypothetical protein